MSSTTDKQEQPFGLWPSPISAQMLAQQIRFDDVQWDSDGETLVWSESRSGHTILVAQTRGEAPRALTTAPSVAGRVLYGGGDFCVASGQVIFAGKDGRLYHRTLSPQAPQPITPAYGSVAAPVLSPNGKWVVYVFSDGSHDCLAYVDLDGQQWPQKLAEGADFYMQPAFHPTGDWLAWVEWDFPNMPWTGSRLALARLSDGESPRLFGLSHPAGGPNQPVSQPAFSPDGRWLSYITQSGNWETLVLHNLENGDEQVLLEEEGLLLSTPAWVQGLRFYGWSPDSRRIFYLRNSAGFASFWQVELESGESRQINTAPYTWLCQISVSPRAPQATFRASSPAHPERIVRWDGMNLNVIARSDPEMLTEADYPTVLPLSWSSPEGDSVYANYYPPNNARYTCGAQRPPAIVRMHGGPSACDNVSFSGERAWYTSRGFGYLEVNFRGSTGFGRAYLDAQQGRWGEIDVQDAVGAAKALVENRLADETRLVITGSSSGGFAVLNALIHHPELFCAGICSYPVSNLFASAFDVHKFELRYNDWLLGALPEAAGRYRQWSPVFHATRIRRPLAVFQGDQDPVVPLQYTQELVQAVRSGGAPVEFQVYAGEGHGFRKAETRADLYQRVERFLREYVLFAP